MGVGKKYFIHGEGRVKLLLPFYCALFLWTFNVWATQPTVEVKQKTSYLFVSTPIPDAYVEVWRSNTLVGRLSSANVFLQHEFFELPASDEGKELQVKYYADNSDFINDADLSIEFLRLSQQQHNVFLLLSGISSSVYPAHLLEVKIRELISEVRKLQTFDTFYCAAKYKLLALLMQQAKFKQVLEVQDEISETSDRQCILNSLLAGNAAFALHRFEQAYLYFQQFVDSEEAKRLLLASPYLEAWAFLKLGFSQVLAGDVSGNEQWIVQGGTWLSQGKKQADKFGETKLLPEFFNAFATYYRVSGDYISSGEMLEQAIFYQKRLGDKDELPALYNNLSFIQLKAGQLAKARDTLTQAISLSRGIGDSISLANQLTNLARVYDMLGRQKVAEHYYKESLSLMERMSINEGRTYSFMALADISYRLGNYVQAIDWLKQAEVEAQTQDKDQIALVYLNMALNQWQLDLKEKSQKSIENAFVAQPMLRRQKDKLRFLLNVAKLDAFNGNKQAFLEHLEQAKLFLPENHPDNLLYEKIYILGMLSLDANSPQITEMLDQSFLRVLSIARQVEQTLDFQKLGPAWMHGLQEITHTYIDYLLKSTKRGNHAKAFSLLEQYYASSLLRSREYYANYKQVSSEPERKALLQIGYAEKMLADSDNEFERDAAKNYLKRLEESVNIEMPTMERQLQSLIDIEQVQQRLTDSEAILRYVNTGQASYVFIITRRVWFVRNVEPEAWRQLLSKGMGTESLLYKLSQLNWIKLFPEEVLSLQGVEKLIIIPDASLHYLPFSALEVITREGDKFALAENYQIVRAYSSASYLNDMLAHNVRQYDINWAIFADPHFSTSKQEGTFELMRAWSKELEPLQWTAREAENILTLFPQHKVKLMLKEDATSDNLMSYDSRHARVLHIATHGYFDKRTPGVVGLATANQQRKNTTYVPGFLSLSQLFSQPFSNQLVVISGCDTMMGDLKASEGLNSLSRGMLAQGAGSVIGTLWKVADKPTSIFMHYFYQYLKQSGDSAYALQQAKIKLRKSGRYRDPKYWAGFVLTSANRQYEKFQF